MNLQTPLALYLYPRVDLGVYCRQDAGFRPGLRKTWWVGTRKHRKGYIDRVCRNSRHRRFAVIQVNVGIRCICILLLSCSSFRGRVRYVSLISLHPPSCMQCFSFPTSRSRTVRTFPPVRLPFLSPVRSPVVRYVSPHPFGDAPGHACSTSCARTTGCLINNHARHRLIIHESSGGPV